ncbi:hypothetical protein IV203_024625 [Nitzschia inconspicua]|uniref:Uncharacterized protein n=1 Tax=Nitzschia inconspicua TaxID=303405 RepID=A0A9K3P7B8_9STRA|nr:hypothetical protein IV203_024625 [Nitzschia inconspicua]
MQLTSSLGSGDSVVHFDSYHLAANPEKMCEKSQVRRDDGECMIDVSGQVVPGAIAVSDFSHSTVENSVHDAEDLEEGPSAMVVDGGHCSLPTAMVRPHDSTGLVLRPPSSSLGSSGSLSSTIDSSSSRRHCVSFGSVEVIEFGMIMGDHPDTEQGPALTIDWTPQCTSRDTVENYEKTRPKRRHLESLKVAPFHREMYLQRIVGVSRDEMEASIRAAKDVRRKREETVRNMKNEKFEMVMQSLQRKTSRLFWGAKTYYPSPETGVSQSLKPTTDDKSQSNNQKKASSPRLRERRSFHHGESNGSCVDLSTATHPPPRTGSRHRRVVSFESHGQ